MRALDSTPLSPILRLSLSESAMPQVLSTVKTVRDFPGGPLVKNPLSKGHMGSIPH